MAEFLIFDNIEHSESPVFDTILEEAYKAKHYPRCLCVSGGVPMYVARVGAKHILKRMPNQGKHHSPSCGSYEVPDGLSGKSHLQGNAIIEDQITGLTTLKLGFSLSRGSGMGVEMSPSDKPNRNLKTNPKKISMRALLEYLWEEGGITTWSPRMAGKRNWFIVRRQILDAAQSKTTKKTALSTLLFVPESFSVENKDGIAARRRVFFQQLKPSSNSAKKQLGIMVGEVKDLTSARFGGKIIVKHMPDMPLYLPEDLYKRIYKAFESQIALFEQDENNHLIFMCSFLLSPSGYPQADELTMMIVDENWIPFDDLEERELVSRMTYDKRYFIKSMRYDLGPKNVVAAAMLTDTKPDPTAIYIIPVGAAEAFYSQLEELTATTEHDSFIWDLNEETALLLPRRGEKDVTTNPSDEPFTEQENATPIVDSLDDDPFPDDNYIPDDLPTYDIPDDMPTQTMSEGESEYFSESLEPALNSDEPPENEPDEEPQDSRSAPDLIYSKIPELKEDRLLGQPVADAGAEPDGGWL